MTETVTVRLDDLQRFVERAGWPPEMLNTLSKDEYRLTMEAGIRLRQIVHRAMLDSISPGYTERRAGLKAGKDVG